MRHKRFRRITICLAGALVLATASLPTAFSLLGAEEHAAPQRDIRFVVIHFPGPSWIEGKSIFEQPGLQAHIDHYRKLLEAGKLMAGGPFLDEAAGGMMIPQPGLTEEEITTFAQEDPAVSSGLLTYQVRRWLVGMKE